MPGYPIQEVISQLDAVVIQPGSDFEVHTLLTDSRKLFPPAGTLFIALKGPNHNGHQFIEDLADRGVLAFVVEEDLPIYPQGVTIIKVGNTRQALQRLAAFHRQHFDIPLVGVTGSNGKTIVKEWLYSLCRDTFRTVRSPLSYNSQVGVPLSLWRLKEDTELGIIEAGISLPGEMERLEKMIRPTIGIFTHLGAAHDENFSSRDAKLREKVKLFGSVRTMIYNRDDDRIHRALKEVLPEDAEIWNWSEYHPEARVSVEREDLPNGGCKVALHWDGRSMTTICPFREPALVEDALHAMVTAIALGVPTEGIAEKVNHLESVPMRMELKLAANGSLLIHDYYNSDVESLKIALDFLERQHNRLPKWVILSDVLESGKDPTVLYGDLSKWLARRGVEKLIGIGPEIHAHQDLFPSYSEFYTSTDAFLEDLHPDQLSNKAILLKGSRPFRFERIARKLEESIHQTVLEIDLEAIMHNLRYFRNRIAPTTRLMVMMKAFGYGSGTFQVANILEAAGVDYLAVAFTNEGVELRKAGIHLPIMVLNPEPESFDILIQHQLEPELYSFRILDAFARKLEERAIFEYPVHLKIETGMHRLGFEEKLWVTLGDRLKGSRRMKVASVLSHLAASDDPEQRDFTLGQITQFDRATRILEQTLGYSFLRHILNSSGISEYPEAQLDMVRLGIGLYGVSNQHWERPNLRTVMRLRTKISQIKELDPGESVGYGRAFIAERPTRIATLPIGYADGLFRSLGNGVGEVAIHGHRAPIVGRVCMDMCMVDVSDIHAEEGDMAEIFGDIIRVEEIARKADTIPYEILTHVSQRVQRIYTTE